MDCKRKLNCLCAFLFLFIAIPSFSQTTITGKVTDQQTGQPLPGVNITVKGSTTTVTTGEDGSFSITARSTDVLLFTYVGYGDVEMKAGNGNLTVSLSTDAKNLDEVVMIGYGTVKRRDLTGSVYSIKNQDIVRTPTFNAVEALQGRIPGVDLTRNSGNPGAGSTIRVRGNRSFFGSNEPLFIIDGFQGGSPSDLNPND